MMAWLSNSNATTLVRPHLLETCIGLIPFYDTHTHTYLHMSHWCHSEREQLTVIWLLLGLYSVSTNQSINQSLIYTITGSRTTSKQEYNNMRCKQESRLKASKWKNTKTVNMHAAKLLASVNCKYNENGNSFQNNKRETEITLPEGDCNRYYCHAWTEM